MGLPCGTFNLSYAQDMAIVRTRMQWIILIAFIVFLLCLPMFMSSAWLAVLNLIGITLVAVLGLAIMTGYTGQISLGHSAFMGVGAYASACLASKVGLPFWVAMPLAGMFAGGVGLIFGAPSLRVKGLYLALATLAAQFILNWVFMHWAFLEGVRGVRAPAPSIAGFVFNTEARYYYIICIVGLIMLFFAKNITRTRMGRAFVAVRDNDIAAEVMGVDVFRTKLWAFFIGCFFAGVAGSLWAHYMNIAHYQHFSLMDSVWYLGMLIVGGLGGIMGPVFGVFLIRLLTEFVAIISPSIPIVGEAEAATLGQMVFGLVVVLFLIFEPRGLLHRWEIFKTSYRLWPFAH